jgi:hypothetical protein
MWAYVFDYIGAWTQRPKPMNETEFNRAKAELGKKVQGIILKGRKCIDDRDKVSSVKLGKSQPISRFRDRRNCASEQNLFEANCI